MSHALTLLWISLGLTSVFFLAIVGMWMISYSRLIAERKSNKALDGMLAAIFSSAEDERETGIRQLSGYVRRSSFKKELLIKALIPVMDGEDGTTREMAMEVVRLTGIDAYLQRMLQSKSLHLQSVACRHAGDLKLTALQEPIRKLVQGRNNDVIYNALLALAKLADLEGLSESLRTNSNHIRLSFRAVVEVITAFAGSKEALIRASMDDCDDYMRGILIKAAADDKCTGLTDYYIKYLNSSNKNLRIACIRAIAETKDTANEPYMIAMLEDKEWEVRAAAAKGLEQVGTKRSLDSLGMSVKDREWWVRQNAASSLIALPGGKEYVNEIINGKDKYASEAIVGVLEMAAT